MKISDVWKQKYISYYKILQEMYKNLVPEVAQEKLFKFISDEDWLLVPTKKEKEIEDGKTREIPNLYFALYENTISIGIVCHTIPSINFFKNITHDFHSEDKRELSSLLTALDDRFTSRLSRKIKDHHFAQTPEYQVVINFKTNSLDSRKIEMLIEQSDFIREEGRKLKEIRNISWPPHTPAIYLTRVEVPKTEADFIEALELIKPICARAQQGMQKESDIYSHEEDTT